MKGFPSETVVVYDSGTWFSFRKLLIILETCLWNWFAILACLYLAAMTKKSLSEILLKADCWHVLTLSPHMADLSLLEKGGLWWTYSVQNEVSLYLFCREQDAMYKVALTCCLWTCLLYYCFLVDWYEQESAQSSNLAAWIVKVYNIHTVGASCGWPSGGFKMMATPICLYYLRFSIFFGLLVDHFSDFVNLQACVHNFIYTHSELTFVWEVTKV